MIMQTVYDAEGTAIQLEPIDAREYLASGAYFEKPPKSKKPADAPAEAAEAAAVADVADEVTQEPEKVRNKPGPKPKVKD